MGEVAPGRKLVVSAELADRLQHRAAMMDEPADRLLERVIEDYLEMEASRERSLDEALAAEEAGLLVEHAQVRAWVDSLSSSTPLPRPKAR